MKKFAAIFIIVVCVFVCLNAEAAPKKKIVIYGNSQENIAETFSAVIMLSEYTENPFKAEKKYVGKQVNVIGRVYEIKTYKGVPIVEFRYDAIENGYAKFAIMRCFVSPKDSKLSKIGVGQTVTINGIVWGIDAEYSHQAYTLERCSIVSIK
ncbi:MAG: hypothetical protein IJG34_02015 [Synergistaceae bacterium]|nr:hypothetical protein [Synergistaceae bacterium]MBQ3448660.1 hypothetical protein [Synergistaceae bacterium]MBQ9629585.1 hypothetical protein [Synergistaceae bacterium]